MNVIVEENKLDGFYVFKEPRSATAIELVYDGRRAVIDEGAKSRSLARAKLMLRIYRWHAYIKQGLCPPVGRWATFRPVSAHRREAELEALRTADRLRLGDASTSHRSHPQAAR